MDQELEQQNAASSVPDAPNPDDIETQVAPQSAPKAMAEAAAAQAGEAAADASVALDTAIMAGTAADEVSDELEEVEESWLESAQQIQQQLMNQGAMLLSMGESLQAISTTLGASLEMQQNNGELLIQLLSAAQQKQTPTELPSESAVAPLEAEIKPSQPEAVQLQEKQEQRRKRRTL